jgi:hypothetical protein
MTQFSSTYKVNPKQDHSICFQEKSNFLVAHKLGKIAENNYRNIDPLYPSSCFKFNQSF